MLNAYLKSFGLPLITDANELNVRKLVGYGFSLKDKQDKTKEEELFCDYICLSKERIFKNGECVINRVYNRVSAAAAVVRVYFF
jgi:hypothetical protein